MLEDNSYIKLDLKVNLNIKGLINLIGKLSLLKTIIELLC